MEITNAYAVSGVPFATRTAMPVSGPVFGPISGPHAAPTFASIAAASRVTSVSAPAAGVDPKRELAVGGGAGWITTGLSVVKPAPKTSDQRIATATTDNCSTDPGRETWSPPV